jgi:hypothetical protein
MASPRQIAQQQERRALASALEIEHLREHPPTASDFDSKMAELVDMFEQSAEAFRTLSDQLAAKAEQPASDDAEPARQGRPSRAARASEEMLAAAPFPELVTSPADKLGTVIRRRSDISELRRAYEFETAHDRRVSVLKAIEERLRRLGHPLGGPEEPFPDYQEQMVGEILRRLRAHGRTYAAHVYAWEWYHSRRAVVLNAAKEIADDLGERLVRETSPRQQQKLTEPFDGFDRLSTSPAKREETRQALRAQPAAVLTQALEYERATKNRVIMLSALETARRAARS